MGMMMNRSLFMIHRLGLHMFRVVHGMFGVRSDRGASSTFLEDQIANRVAVDDEPRHAVLRVPLKDDHRDGRRAAGEMVLFVGRQADVRLTGEKKHEAGSA